MALNNNRRKSASHFRCRQCTTKVPGLGSGKSKLAFDLVSCRIELECISCTRAVHNRNEMMKHLPMILAALLAAPMTAFATDPASIDVYLGGELQHSVSLAGRGSFVTFSPIGLPNTKLEFRLIAPEPLIIEMKETMTGNEASETTGRIKLVAPGSSVAVADVKGAKFHDAYVLVRAK